MLGFNEEECQILDAVARVCRDYLIPASTRIDERDVFPSEEYRLLGDHGILSLVVPEEFNGLGVSTRCWAECISRISAASASLAMSVIAGSALVLPIALFAADSLKRQILPALATGDSIVCFCLTEPSAGSDVRSISTTARKQGDEYIINGSKIFITLGSVADYFIIFAKVREDNADRLSCFLATKDMPGLLVGRDEKKLGLHGSVTTELHFENLRIPAENLLGGIGDGYKIAYSTLDRSRLYVAAMGVGIARAARDAALDYALTRVQYGKPIMQHQAIQNKIVDMEIGIEAGEALVQSVAGKIDNGLQPIKEASCAKVFCTDIAVEATSQAVQVLGGYGYCKEYPVERYFRDAKALPIFEGANEVQRNIIGKALVSSNQRVL